MTSLTAPQIDTTRLADLLSEAADQIAAAGDMAPADSTLVGLARLTSERLAEAQHQLAAHDCSALHQPIIDAATTIDAFRRLANRDSHPQAGAVAALAGTFIVDAALTLRGDEVAPA